MIQECAPYAVAVASRSKLYHYHPRQDLESIYYLFVRIMIILLLKPPKEQEVSRTNHMFRS